MCYRPLRIVNPIKNPTLRDKLYLEVPCGTCNQCRQKKVNDFAVRAYFESLFTNKVHGRVFMCTFTYNLINIPRVMYNGSMIPCFDKKDIQKFMKCLRKRIGYDCVRYIITSEFGDIGNLPHHHAIIYINKYIDDKYLHDVIMDIKHTWQGLRKWRIEDSDSVHVKRGFCKVELVDSFRAFFYVSKYINKYIAETNDLPDSCKPFHLQSKGFGLYMIDYFGFNSNKNQCKNMQSIIDGSIVMPYGKISVLPQYISRKLLFDYEYQYITETIDDRLLQKKLIVKYHLNDFGLYIKKQRSYRSIELTKKEVDDVLTLDNISHININHANKYLHSNFKSYDEIYKFVKKNLPNDASKANFCLYISTFCDRLVIPYSNDLVFSPFAFSSDMDVSSTSYTSDVAKDYIDFLFDKDIEYIDTYDGIRDSFKVKDYKFTNYIDVVSQQLYNTIFPLEYGLIRNILNYILYAQCSVKNKKYIQNEIFAHQAKLINHLNII